MWYKRLCVLLHDADELQALPSLLLQDTSW